MASCISRFSSSRQSSTTTLKTESRGFRKYLDEGIQGRTTETFVQPPLINDVKSSTPLIEIESFVERLAQTDTQFSAVLIFDCSFEARCALEGSTFASIFGAAPCALLSISIENLLTRSASKQSMTGHKIGCNGCITWEGKGNEPQLENRGSVLT